MGNKLENKQEKKTLYLECYSGISGDMTVASLIDLGADKDVLLAGLSSLNVDGYKIVIGRRTKSSIDACDFDVILDGEEMHGHNHNHDHNHNHNENHNHDHNHNDKHHHDHDQHSLVHDHKKDHDHTSEHGHSHNHNNEVEVGHTHDHEEHIHTHDHGHLHLGHREHRNLHDVNSIIDQSSISDNAKDIAKRIFHIVAVAESTAHGKPINEIHFHEVGAIDSIVDIVATAICIDNLNIGDVIVSELYEGTGHIKCQHGTLPVPVPAVVNIAVAHQLSLHITSIKGEMVTPTGAAIVAAIKTKDTLPKKFSIQKLGLGAGKREYEQAGILRAMLILDNTTN
jgi:uncharacterized protein (DUF111 family)